MERPVSAPRSFFPLHGLQRRLRARMDLLAEVKLTRAISRSPIYRHPPLPARTGRCAT